jgi:membrane protease YdiL (CAAX protease family)
VTRRRTLTALAAYAALAALALTWAWATIWPAGGSLWRHPRPWLALTPERSLVVSLGGGVALALLVVLASRVLVRRARWARRLHLGFRGLLGELSDGQVLAFALASGLVEELVFRGALQPLLGWVPTALAFGLIHVGPDRRFVPWTISAVVVGLLLGGLYELTGHLAGCVLAHVLVNFVNLRHIRAEDLGARELPQPRAPSLVGDRTRATRR